MSRFPSWSFRLRAWLVVALVFFALPAHFGLGAEPDLAKLIANYANEKFCGVVCIDMETGRRLAEHNPDRLLHPDGTQMLATQLAALDLLGADYRFLTTLAVSGEFEDGVVSGDLIVEGRGDPTLGRDLSGSARKDGEWDPLEVFREWGREIREQGVERIQGRVLADGRYFSDEGPPAGWPDREENVAWLADTSALVFHDNGVMLHFEPKWWNGSEVPVTMIPEQPLLKLHNSVRVDKDLERPRIQVSRQPDSGLVQVRGAVPRRTEAFRYVSVEDGNYFFTFLLRKALLEAGVTMEGPAVAAEMLMEGDALTTSSWPLVLHRSPALAEISEFSLGEGNRLHADLLLKTLGRIKGEGGSFQAGAKVLRDYLQLHVQPRLAPVVLDGSGISTRNAMSAATLAELLRQGPRIVAGFEDFLPRAEESSVMRGTLLSEHETLGHSFRGLQGARLTGCKIAGYLEGASGRRLAVAVLIDDPMVSASTAETAALRCLEALREAF